MNPRGWVTERDPSSLPGSGAPVSRFAGPGGGRGARQGAVLTVLVVLGMLLVALWAFTRDAASRTLHLRSRALTKSGILDEWNRAEVVEAQAEFIKSLADPSHPHYKNLRTLLIEFLGDGVGLGPESVTQRGVPSLALQVDPHDAFRAWSADIESWVGIYFQRVTPFLLEDDVADVAAIPLDERVGLIEFHADQLERGPRPRGTNRYAVKSHEFKMVLVSPPRPFDRLPVYLDDAGPTAGIEEIRRAQDEIRREIDQVRSTLGGRASEGAWVRGTIARIEAAFQVAGRDEATGAFMEIPERLVFVARHSHETLDVGRMQLAGRLAPGLEELRARTESLAVEVASSRLDRTGIDGLVAGIENDLAAIRAVLGELKQQVQVLDGASFSASSRLDRYRPRLTPRWFEDRVMLRFPWDAPLFHQVRQGRRALHGVFEVAGEAGLRLSGGIPGRMILLVREGPVVLDSIPAPARPGDWVTVVAQDVPVELRGEVHASLVLIGKSEVTFADGHLRGTLSMGPDSRLVGSGQVSLADEASAGRSPLDALEMPGTSRYALGISPVPLMRGSY